MLYMFLDMFLYRVRIILTEPYIHLSVGILQAAYSEETQPRKARKTQHSEHKKRFPIY